MYKIEFWKSKIGRLPTRHILNDGDFKVNWAGSNFFEKSKFWILKP